MEERKKPNLIHSFIQYFYGNFVVLLLGFLSLPLITRMLDTDEYGRTSMFQSVVTVIYIFAILGMDQAYIRYFYKENIDRRSLLKKCITPALFIVFFLSLLYCVLAKHVNLFLFEKTGFDISLLVIVYTFLSVLERFFFLHIRMEQNGKLYSNMNILSKILYIVFLWGAFTILGNEFTVVLYAMTLSLGCTTGMIIIRYFYKEKRVEKKERQFYVPKKELMKYGMPFVMTALMEWLLSSCDKYSLRIFSTMSQVGIYASAMQIMVILLTFKATFVAFWAPIAMEKYEQKTKEDCSSFFQEVFSKVQFLSLLAAFSLILFKDVVVLLLGEKYRDAGYIIPFLVFMPILSILYEITSQGIKFKKKIRYYNYASAAAIVCNLGGNAILVPKFGALGAAMATGITYILYFAMGSYFSKKCYPVAYEYKKTMFYVALLVVYGLYASFFDNDVIGVLFGIGGMAVITVMERKNVKEIGDFVWKVAKGIRKEKGKA
jgi:O-antigen/teichoic acid export membrane protein